MSICANQTDEGLCRPVCECHRLLTDLDETEGPREVAGVRANDQGGRADVSN